MSFCTTSLRLCRFTLQLCAFSVLCGWSFDVASAATVEPVDGEPFEAELVAVGDRAATFRVADARPQAGGDDGGEATRSLSPDELVRWGHPALPRAQTMVLLDDGSRLVTAAAWAGGAAVRSDSNSVFVLSDALDEVRLPRKLVRGLVFDPRSRPQDREQLANRVLTADVRRDEVWLTNGDRLSGQVSALSGGSLTLATDAGEVKLPLGRVQAVVSGSRQSSGVSRQAQWRVGLRDGSALLATEVRADAEGVSLKLVDGIEMAGGAIDDIVALQVLRSEQLVYVSDLEPADYRHVPYLSISWPWQRDRNVLGEPLTVGGRRWWKGIGMHSAARLTYRLEGAYRRYYAAVAVDDAAGGRGSVTFAVFVLRDGRWQEAFTSGIVRGGEEPQRVSVDVTGAVAMTLVVDFADRGDELDYANWLDARLLK